ncbi:MAG: D-cysteine desulfhydrase family protein [Polyangiaceae bacterium]
MTTAPRLRLAHAPTPIDAGDRALAALGLADRGIELFIKRDDMTGGVEAGNKIRKLEFLVADALEKRATTLVTCGGIQSNHARATATIAAKLGLACVVLLRTTGEELDVAKVPATGNLFLCRLVGADVRLITVAQYRERNALMRSVAADLSAAGARPYVIPEGGSNGIGSLGYVEAMREVRAQIDAGMCGSKRPFDVIVHACGSGGTAAGVALGASQFDVAGAIRPIAVCDDQRTFEEIIARVVVEARAADSSLGEPAPVSVDDREKGPMYGVASPEQKALVRAVARSSGLVLDPVYTGKAFAGFARLAREGALDGKRVLFLHTGGLPGLLAESAAF